MQKIVLILICVLAFIQCSVVRNVKSESSYELEEQEVLASTKNQNITTDNFTVARADFQIRTNTGTEKIIGSIKYENPQKYLISIRSRVGIELARIYISKDTLLINDRINRKIYYGKPDYLEKKYDIPFLALPLVLGDYIDDNKQDSCISYKTDGKLSRYCTLGQFKIQYLIDYKRKKTVSALILDYSGKAKISISYEGFIKIGCNLFPGRIQIKDYKSSLSVDIKIKNIEKALKGKIEFIPGSKYELIKLL